MSARPSITDLDFRERFEAGEVGPSEFDHRGHLRLAYTYLCEDPLGGARERMHGALSAFLARHGVDAGHYHETLTVAWLGALRHFMDEAGATGSFDELLAHDDRLLDKDIMLTHYSRERLFSDEARNQYLAPDIQPIPPR